MTSDLLHTRSPFRDMAKGCEVRVLVQPGASRERIVGLHGERLKLAVTAPPERGKANEAARDLLSRALGIRRADVQLISGHASREKTFFIPEVNAETLRRKIQSTGESVCPKCSRR